MRTHIYAIEFLKKLYYYMFVAKKWNLILFRLQLQISELHVMFFYSRISLIDLRFHDWFSNNSISDFYSLIDGEMMHALWKILKTMAWISGFFSLKPSGNARGFKLDVLTTWLSKVINQYFEIRVDSTI